MRQIRELREEEKSETSWFVLPDEGDDDVNWSDFTVEIEGPSHYDGDPSGHGFAEPRPSPYADGLFRVQIKLERDYPITPPKVKFMTKIWHPNVDYEKGEPCVDFLTESWKPEMTLRHVLQTIRGLMALPNTDMSINTTAASELAESIDVFDKHAASETKRYATD